MSRTPFSNVNNIHVHSRQTKTDVLRDGNIAVIGRTGNDTCPVKLLERYLLQAKINPLSAEDIFRSIHVSHQAVYKL